MHWALAESDDETAELREYVRAGQLLAVQKWIAAKKPVYCEGSRRQQALQIAVDKGFHSMVEVLASVWPAPESLNAALNQAARKRRVDLVWLLLDKGADLKGADLRRIAGCNDKELMRFFFDHWDDLKIHNGLIGVVLAMPRALVGVIREYAPQIPESQRQLAMALKHFVTEDHPKWVALTMWMGGNPRLAVPDCFQPPDDPEDWTTALEDAAMAGSIEALYLMKPSPKLDDLDKLLSYASFLSNYDNKVIDYILECGANINNKPNGGSTIIDSLWEAPKWPLDLYSSRRFGYGDVERIKKWVSKGARWVPDDKYSFRCARAALKDLSSIDAWKFIQFLSQTVDKALLVELCNTSILRKALGVTPKELEQRIAGFTAKREEAEERRRFFPRHPKRTSYVQKRPGILAIKETVTSRQKLYEEVWSRPLADIAASYCITTEQLASVCNAHDIPRPNAGHWQKVSAGKPVKKKPLSNAATDSEIRIRAQGNLPDIQSLVIRAQASALIERLATPKLEVQVPYKPDVVHRLLAEYRAERESRDLHSGTLLKTGRTAKRPGSLAIKVREDMQDRAECIMNALLFFLEEFGVSVSVSQSEWGHAHTQASLFGGSSDFAIDEECGRMRLNLFGYGHRNRWCDGRRQLVEECFADFTATLVYTVALQGK